MASGTARLSASSNGANAMAMSRINSCRTHSMGLRGEASGGTPVALGTPPRRLARRKAFNTLRLAGSRGIFTTVEEDDMRSKIAIMLFAALFVGGSSAALAQDTQPVMLSKQQLMHQDQETRVLNLLSANGYTDIGPLQQAGNSYITTATKAGKQVQVTVDPQAGTVSGM